MQFSKNELIGNRTFWYVFSIFLTVGYLFIGLKLLKQLPVNHDELVYIIKSWWLFSGQTDWYSDDTPLWYLPGAYFWPGLSQMIFGHGFHGARAIGFIAGFGANLPSFFIRKKTLRHSGSMLLTRRSDSIKRDSWMANRFELQYLCPFDNGGTNHLLRSIC
jgi:hypothetical protein